MYIFKTRVLSTTPFFVACCFSPAGYKPIIKLSLDMIRVALKGKQGKCTEFIKTYWVEVNTLNVLDTFADHFHNSNGSVENL